jgi:hypothetical protein
VPTPDKLDNIKIFGQLTILNCGFSMDGGSRTLLAKDGEGQEIEITIFQHGIPANFRKNKIPGRLHLNGHAIEIRSQDEKEIIDKLKGAKIEPFSTLKDTLEKEPGNEVALMTMEMIDFVLSDEYVAISKL